MPRKPKAAPVRTLITLLLDESGSMSPIHSAIVSGVNEYLHDRRKEANVFVSIRKFDSNGTRVYCDMLPAKQVPDMKADDYAPAAMTPLYDAVNETIHRADLDYQPGDNVIIVIMTDGLENASEHITDVSTIKQLIEQRQKDGWTFSYLGANHNPWEVALSFGIPIQNTASYRHDDHGTHVIMSHLSGATANYVASSGGATARSSNTFLSQTGDVPETATTGGK